ncbi:MAG: MoxR family ATPase [Chloroflexi bacterium]|nr:MoxR family ATPase [Chloroflexota bacterium]
MAPRRSLLESTAVDTVAEAAQQLRESIERVIVGKGPVIELLLVAVLADGHVLIEDVPGIGKTLMARSLARSVGYTFRRIQCTPDLLPADITGTYIFNQKAGDFEFRPGPLFAQLVLADEINRATPRTQSALLEAMEERQVTVEGETRALPRPFLLLATQNPIELEGTFPLPEAQLDRFLMRVRIGYPTAEQDEAILDRFALRNPIEELAPVVSAERVLALQQTCRQVKVAPDIRRYIVQLVHATRQHAQVELGASPRAMQGLFRTSQVLASLRGRSYVIPDDVKYLMPYVLEHRVILRSQSHLHGRTSADLLREVLASAPVPVEDPL